MSTKLQRTTQTLTSYVDPDTGYSLTEIYPDKVELTRAGAVHNGVQIRMIVDGPLARALAELRALFGEQSVGLFLARVHQAELNLVRAPAPGPYEPEITDD